MVELKRALESCYGKKIHVERFRVARTGDTMNTFDTRTMYSRNVKEGDELTVDCKDPTSEILTLGTKSIEEKVRIVHSVLEPTHFLEYLALVCHCIMTTKDAQQ